MRLGKLVKGAYPLPLALAGLLVLAACSSAGSAGTASSHSASASSSEGPSKSVTIRFGYQTTGWGAPAVVADGMNAWSGLDVKVETKPLNSGLVVRNGLLGGSLDAGIVGASGGYIDGAVSGDLVAVGVAEYAGKTLALVTKSGITSPEQLKGKKIASQLGSGTDTAWKHSVGPAIGLPDGSYTYVNIKFANMTSALATGQVDAFAGVDPFNQVAVVGGYGKILTDFSKYDPTPVYLVFTQTFAANHPEAVEQFLEGWLRVVKKFDTDPAGVAKLASSAFNSKGAGKDAATITKKSLEDLTVVPDFAPNTNQYLTSQVKFLQQNGKANLQMPDWSKAINKSALKKAEAAAGYTPPKLPASVTDWTPSGTS